MSFERNGLRPNSMSYGRNGLRPQFLLSNVLWPQWPTAITERCKAILIKIYQNSEVTEQNFARHRLFQSPSTITERCQAILIKIYQNSEVTEQKFARRRLIQSHNCLIELSEGN